jgi:hypothetical protein
MADEVVACYTMQEVVHNHSYSTPAVKKVTRWISILSGDFGENPLSNLQQDAQSQMTAIAVAIPLAHQSFGAIILAFHKAIGEARRQKVKEGQNFPSPVAEGRQVLSTYS